MKTNEIVAVASSSRSDMLRDVRRFIERGWTQGAGARDTAGKQVETDSPAATCFCLSGAAMAAFPERPYVMTEALAKALGFLGYVDLVNWNDKKGRTQAEVLARIDQALERAGGGA